jgi:glutamyl-Q tRNA(Asp) synthetase
LHLGSLATAIGGWLDAKTNHGRWLLRIEDVDYPRCVAGAAQHIMHTLQRFELHWDGEVMVQSQRNSAYKSALTQLTQLGLTYPCGCTRKDVEDLQGQRQRNTTAIYPGTCRQGLAPGKTARSIRFKASETPVKWLEFDSGEQQENVSAQSGDFVIQRADGLWAYQLAVVVDDIVQGITDVVRGSDLSDSTGKQIALFRALQAEAPCYWHLPLVLNDAGEKLSKQSGATALNLACPVAEMNRAFKVFGLPDIAVETPGQWLAEAMPLWANYRGERAFKPPSKAATGALGRPLPPKD